MVNLVKRKRPTRSSGCSSREKTDSSEKDWDFLLELDGRIYSASKVCHECNLDDTFLPDGIIIDGKMTCNNSQCMKECTLKMEKDISSSLVSSASEGISCLTVFSHTNDINNNAICSNCSSLNLKKKESKNPRSVRDRCSRPWDDSNRTHRRAWNKKIYQITMQKILDERTEQDLCAKRGTIGQEIDAPARPVVNTRDVTGNERTTSSAPVEKLKSKNNILPTIKNASSLVHKTLKNSRLPNSFSPNTRGVDDLVGRAESPIRTGSRSQGRRNVLGDLTNTCVSASKLVKSKFTDKLKNSNLPQLVPQNTRGRQGSNMPKRRFGDLAGKAEYPIHSQRRFLSPGKSSQSHGPAKGDINPPRNVLEEDIKINQIPSWNLNRVQSSSSNPHTAPRPAQSNPHTAADHLQESRNLFVPAQEISRRDHAKSILDDLFKSTDPKVMSELLGERGFSYIPVTSRLVNKSHLSSLERMWNLALKARAKFKRKKYKSHTSLQRRFNAFSALLAPTVSQDKMETVSQLSRAATIEEFEIKSMVGGLSGRGKIHDNTWDDRTSNTGIKHSTVGNLTGEAATDLLFLLREDLLLVSSLFANSDKGQGGHMVKVLSWFSAVKNRVDKFIIDVDKCSGYSSETASGIKYSMDRIFIDKKYRVDGGATDAGGGGTGESLKKEMVKLGIMPPWACVAFCALHGIQLIFKTPVEKALGFGGLGKRSPLQLLHDYYDLQIAMGKSLWEKRWREAAKKLGIPMIDEHGEETDKVPWLQEPVMSRWWTVGQGAKQASNNEAILIEVLMCTIESKRANSEEAIFKIATNALSLALEKEAQSDLKLIKGFAKFFLDDHMNWFQLGDARIGDTAGFNSRNMLVRYFLMHYDLNRLAATEECWRNAIEFKDFMATLDGPENGEIVKQDEHTLLRDLRSVPIRKRSVQIKKAHMIFHEALRQLHSVAHFKPYKEKLFFLGLFGEHQTSKILASKIHSKGESTAAGSGSYYCPYQKREIDLKAFEEFIDWVGIDENAEKIKTDWNQVADERNFHHMAIFSKDDLETIASTDIWEEEGPSVSANLVHRFKMNYSALPSTTHFVERGVKIAGISSNSKRSDTRASHYAIGSNFTENVNRITIEKMKSKFDYKNEEAIVPRGKIFSEHLLAEIEGIDTRINKLCLDKEKKAVYTEMHTRLNEEKLAFRHNLVNFAVDAGDKQQHKRKGMKAPKASLVRGMDRTEAMNGAFCFKDLKKDKHWDMLGKELEARDLNAPHSMTFTQLKARVRTDEGGMERQGFIPKFSSLDRWSRATAKKQDRDQKRIQITKEKKKTEKLQQSGRVAGTVRSNVEVEN